MNYLNQKMPSGYSADHAENKDISISEILHIISRRKVGISLIILATVLISLIYHFSETPDYKAMAVLIINQQGTTQDMVAAVLGGGPAADSKMAQKDVELMQTKQMAEMTVRALWKGGRRDSLEFFGYRPYVSPVRQMIQWIIPINKNVEFQNSVVENTPAYDAMMRKYATALNERINVDTSRDTSVLIVSVASPFADESVYLTNMLCDVYRKSDIQRNSEKYLQSNRYVAEMLAEQKQLLANADSALSKFMSNNQMYEVTGNTAALLGKMIEFDGRYHDIMAEYNISKNAVEFLEKQLSQADRELSARIAKNVGSQLGVIQEEIRKKEAEYITLLREKPSDDPVVKIKKQELEQAKIRYEQLSKSKIAGQISYVGKAQKSRFDLISEKLQLEQKLNQLSFSASEYQKVKKIYDSQLSKLPEKEQEYVRLERDREVVSKTYLFLKEKLDETRILIGSEVGSVSMVGTAFKPFNPESPVLSRNLIFGVALGSILAALYIIAVELLDDTVNEEMQFFKSIGFNIWGVIPFISSSIDQKNIKDTKKQYSSVKPGGDIISKITTSIKKDKNKDNEAEKTIVGRITSYPLMTEKLNSSFAESFRSLRTNLNFSKIDKPFKTILVSGCSIGEGKSTVSANLALAWAIADKKTLLIDGDLRRPSQHSIFSKKRSPGLTDCLISEKVDIENQFIQKTHLENLHLISAGTPVPNPNELLGSEKMHDLLTLLTDKYDRIIIDSPPIFISDAAQLVNEVDGILITARLHYSSRAPLKQYASDNYLHSKIIGVAIIDKPRPSKIRYGYSDNKYGYGKSGYGRYSSVYPEKL
jgi:succinoglycan biosynthesis transport protein ExoP